MQSINALSLAPDARDWLAYSRHPRILHVFDHACNLINERREVLSIVTPQIGNGPFNLMISILWKSSGGFPDLDESRQTSEVSFSHLSLQSPVSNSANQLTLGDLTISTADAKLWAPRPDWERLHARREGILNQLKLLQIIAKHPFGTNYQIRGGFPLRGLRDTPFDDHSGLPFDKLRTGLDYHKLPITLSLISNLSSALVNADISSAQTITSQLAGLGQGLTPAGDDFIMGAVLAAWIIHPPEVASVLAEEITKTAAPLTTSLSAAWLRSAGRGEAGILWHNFFDALILADPVRVQESMDKILAVGETSGADALMGFFCVFMSWAETFRRDLLPKAIR